METNRSLSLKITCPHQLYMFSRPLSTRPCTCTFHCNRLRIPVCSPCYLNTLNKKTTQESRHPSVITYYEPIYCLIISLIHPSFPNADRLELLPKINFLKSWKTIKSIESSVLLHSCMLARQKKDRSADKAGPCQCLGSNQTSLVINNCTYLKLIAKFTLQNSLKNLLWEGSRRLGGRGGGWGSPKLYLLFWPPWLYSSSPVYPPYALFSLKSRITGKYFSLERHSSYTPL